MPSPNTELIQAFPALCLFFGSFLIFCVILAVVAIYFIDRVLSDARELSRTAIEQCRQLSTSVLLASSGLNPNGLNPNVVDPERFGPTGMPRRDEPAPPTTKEAPEELSEEEIALREAEADYLAQRSIYNPDGSRRVTMTGARGAPPGASAST